MLFLWIFIIVCLCVIIYFIQKENDKYQKLVDTIKKQNEDLLRQKEDLLRQQDVNEKQKDSSNKLNKKQFDMIRMLTIFITLSQIRLQWEQDKIKLSEDTIAPGIKKMSKYIEIYLDKNTFKNIYQDELKEMENNIRKELDVSEKDVPFVRWR